MANNNILFNAALNAIGGTLEGRWSTATTPSMYARYLAIMNAFATAIDTQVPPGSPTQQEADLLHAIAKGFISGRDINSTNIADYLSAAQSIVAVYNELKSSVLMVPVLADIDPYKVLGRNSSAGTPEAIDRHVRSLQWWATTAPAINADRWVSAISIAYTTTERDSGPYIIGSSCTAIALTFNNTHTALATDNVVVTLMRAPNLSNVYANTALTFTIPAGTVTGTMVQDITHQVTLNAGDKVVLKLRQAGATAQATWYARFELLCV